MSNRPPRTIDWAAIREGVESAKRATAEAAWITRDEALELLRERARLLARPASQPDDGFSVDVVTFGLARGAYALELRFLHEVYRLRGLTPLPGVGSPVMGVTAWRGEILTIIDLRPIVGAPVAALNDLGRVLVLGEGRAELGVLVDDVRALATLRLDELSEAPDGLRVAREMVRGITDESVLLLDAERLLRIMTETNPTMER